MDKYSRQSDIFYKQEPNYNIEQYEEAKHIIHTEHNMELDR